MKIKFVVTYFILPILIGLTGCANPPVTTLPVVTSIPTPTPQPDPTDITEKPEPVIYWHISDVVSTEDLTTITGYSDYQYIDSDYDDAEHGEPAGQFWSVYTATVEIKFRAHLYGGTEKLEDYRTAANPGSLVWVESPLWDSGCYYRIGEWDADFVVVRGDACYYIGFVPSAYPEFDPVDLGKSLMTMFVENSNKK